ncbi:MAG: hypothetical protein ACO1N0_05670 [Fluviicola sp.]
METKKQGFLLAALFLFFGMSQAAAQEKNPQTVIIRAFEFSFSEESRMTVTSPDGSTKVIELTFIDSGTLYGDAENSVIIQSQINEWKKQGFEIDGMSTQSSDAARIVTTIILSKD